MCGDVEECCGGNIKSNMTTATHNNNSANLGYVAASSINFQSPQTPTPPTYCRRMEADGAAGEDECGEEDGGEETTGAGAPGGGSRERMIFKQQTNKQTNKRRL